MIVCGADQSGTSHDVMVTRMPWHSLMQHNITVDPQADIRPCAPRQLPSHWLNKYSQRDFRDLGARLLDGVAFYSHHINYFPIGQKFMFGGI